MSRIVNNPSDTRPTTTPTTTTTTGSTTTFAGKPNRNLQFVEDLDDYKVHHDDVDIRDFDVKTLTGETIGEVEGLLADVTAKRVRYVEIEIEDDVISRHTGTYSDDDRNILIPVGLVQINAADKSISLHGITFDQLLGYPLFNRKNGYTVSYELDANNYLSDFHEYGTTYQRDVYDTDHYRNSDHLGDTFYTTRFYTGS